MTQDDFTVAMRDLEAAQKLLQEAGHVLLYKMDSGLTPHETLQCRNLVDRANALIGSLAGYLSIKNLV